MEPAKAKRTRRESLFIALLGIIVFVAFVAAVQRPAEPTAAEIAPFVKKLPPGYKAPAVEAAAEPAAAPAPERDLAYEGAVAEDQAKDAVKALLRDPESAEFRDVQAIPHQNGIAVCGQVNAKNGFGGYTGYEYFMVAGTHALVRSDENATQFQKLWRRLCQ